MQSFEFLGKEFEELVDLSRLVCFQSLARCFVGFSRNQTAHCPTGNSPGQRTTWTRTHSNAPSSLLSSLTTVLVHGYFDNLCELRPKVCQTSSWRGEKALHGRGLKEKVYSLSLGKAREENHSLPATHPPLQKNNIPPLMGVAFSNLPHTTFF